MNKEETIEWLETKASQDQCYLYLIAKQIFRHSQDIKRIKDDLKLCRFSKTPLHKAMWTMLEAEKERHMQEIGNCVDIEMDLFRRGVSIPKDLNYDLWIEV